MFLPLLTTLVLLGQAPTSSEVPLSVLIAPPDAAGVPSHIVSFSQEHVYEQLKLHGLRVVRTTELARMLPPSQRRRVLRCNRLKPSCRMRLGKAAQVETVMIVELAQFRSGYRVALKSYATSDGALLAEQSLPGVREDLLLDTLTEASEKLVPQVLQELRPQPPVVQAPDTPVAQAAPDTPVAQAAPDTPVAPLEPVAPFNPPALSSGPPGWAWVPAAGGVVLLGAGTYFLVQAHQNFTQLQGQGPVDGYTVAESGKRAQDLSRATFALGAAGLVTSGIIYLLSDKGPSAEVHPTATVGPQGAMVGVAGTLP